MGPEIPKHSIPPINPLLLLTLTVTEIINLVRAHYPAPLARQVLLERFGLIDLAQRQTGGLSGGQRRRLAVALAFAGDPQAVFLDEPTTGLDVEARRELWQSVRAYALSPHSAIW